MKLLICVVIIIGISLVVVNSSPVAPSSTPSSNITCPRKEIKGVFLEPQNRECMGICHPRKQKRINWVCGEQEDPPKDGNSTITLYINECERGCDFAKPADLKMCKHLNKLYRAGDGQKDRVPRYDCDE